MKKLLIISALISVYSIAFAQEKADSIQYKYCDVITLKKVGGPKYCIITDSGQLTTGGLIPNQYKDINGNAYIFNSQLDGINFMISHKWEMFQVYFDNTNSHYLLRKKIVQHD
jgi:hypothetical protein